MDDEIISSYSRAQAIADGVLIDVTETAKQAGFVWPVAVTEALWRDIEDSPKHGHRMDTAGARLWDVLWMAYVAIKRARAGGTMLCYQLIMPVGEHVGADLEDPRNQYTVKLISGPGDELEPVITLMKPNED